MPEVAPSRKISGVVRGSREALIMTSGAAGNRKPKKNIINTMSSTRLKGKKMIPNRFPCHCCHKPDTVYWLEKRQTFICGNCMKTFDRAIIAARNGMAAEQLSFC